MGNGQYSGNLQLNINLPVNNTHLSQQHSGNMMPPQNTALNAQYSGNQIPINPQLHNILNAQQLQQVQSMASYHYEQYAMINQQQHALRQRQQQQQQIQFQKMQKQSAVPKVKFNKRKKEKLLKKRKAGVQMQYIKLQRYFQMNDDQKAILSQNLYEVQQQLQQYAQIQVVPELDCYELLIPSNTPLPQRKTYWQNVLKMTRNSIGMSMEHIMQ